MIARALSKTPTERFANCRELVDALLAVRMHQKFGPPQHSTVQRQDGPQVATQSFSSPDDGSSLRTPDAMLADLNEATAAANWSPELDRVCEPEPARPAMDLPPVDFDPTTWTTRPTLFVGVGGTGRRALEALKQRWQDHFLGSGPSMRVLGLDTDVQPTGSANVDEAALLRPDETLELPLRKPQDYRRDGAKFGTWLSRRWLFNIPRSQQTEGIRPLGRLALTDHCERVREAFTSALQALMTQDASSARNTTAGGAAAMPRVVLVGGIGGGTGGGMLVDLCYLIRQTLDDLKLHSGELVTVLAHATPRNPATQEVAAATAFSTLSEFAHYLRPGVGYFGDPSCGLKPLASQRRPFDAAYLMHLGTELTPLQYERGVDRLGEFLFLESATPAGGYLAACRRADEGAEDHLTLRTVGLCQLGFSQDQLLTELTDEVCRETIHRWLGTPRPNLRGTTSASLSVLTNRHSVSQTPAKEEELDRLAAHLFDSLQIDQVQLSALVRGMIEADVGQESDSLVRTLATAENGEDELRLLSRVNQLLGARDEQGELPEAREAPVRQAIDAGIRTAGSPLGERMRIELEALVESPLARVHGSARAVKQVLGRLKTLSDELRSTRTRLNQELLQLQPFMLPYDPRQKSKRTPAEIASGRQAYCRLRLEDTIAAGAQQLAGLLQSYAGQARDLALDLDRELKTWQDQFRDFDSTQFVMNTEADDEGRTTADRSPMDILRSTISSELRQQIPSVAAVIDQNISTSYLAANGGLRGVILAGGQVRQDLARILHELARRGMSHVLQTIDIPTLLSKIVPATDGTGATQGLVTQALRAAESPLKKCGGNRRLVSLIPNPQAAQWPADRVARWLAGQGFGHKPAVLNNCGSDTVLLYEVGGVSLRLAAGTMIEFRPDLADVGRRLHTRTDVQWAPLPVS